MARTRKVKTGQDQPQVLPLMRPPNPDSVLEVARRFHADPNSVNFSDLKNCLLSAADWRAISTAYDEAVEAGKTLPELPYYYNPAWFRIANRLGFNIAYQGKAAVNDKAPKHWPGSLPTWQPGMRVKASTNNHVRDLRRNVEGFEDGKSQFLVEFGRLCVVIGDNDNPAHLMLSGSKGESTYSAGLSVLKNLAFKEQESKLERLVFSINTQPQTLRMSGDGSKRGGEVTVLPYESATAGYLQRDGRNMTYQQIRDAVESGETSGIKFVPLDAPIIGETRVSQSQLVQGVKRKLSAKGTVREGEEETAFERFETRKRRKGVSGERPETADKIWYNVREVMTRATANAIFAFGIRHGLTDMVPIRLWGEAADDRRVGFAIGLRSGEALTDADRVRVRANDTADEAAEAETATPRKRGRPRKAEATAPASSAPAADEAATVPTNKELATVGG